MINMIDILGKDWEKIELFDDNVISTGGLSRMEETLGDFCKEADIDPYFTTIGELQKELKNCGIQQIEIADQKIEEIIEQKHWDLEEELGISIIWYRWDYKEF